MRVSGYLGVASIHLWSPTQGPPCAPGAAPGGVIIIIIITIIKEEHPGKDDMEP